MPRRPEGARRTDSPEVARVRALLDALSRPADQPRQNTGGPLRPGVGRPDGALPPEEGEGSSPDALRRKPGARTRSVAGR